MLKLLKRKPKSANRLADITRKTPKQNLELAEHNKSLSLLRRIEVIMLNHAAEPSGIAAAITAELIKESDFNLAMIYTLSANSNLATLQGVSSSKKTDKTAGALLKDKLKSISIHSISHNAFSHAASKMRIYVATGFTSFNPKLTVADNQQLKAGLGVASIFICPLLANQRLNGILVLGLPLEKDQITAYQKTLVEQLTQTVSLAIENRRLQLELKSANLRLAAQNSQLQELNQAKEEFISLVSQQLRAPLTAVKGYLSLVLEGNREPMINRQMIQRAYDGIQRLFYQLGDLLSLSHMQSGRLIIENEPTDLINLVQAEVGQLLQAARDRKIKLTHEQPVNFPVLMLDGPKIRQVVRHLLQNAIDYTASGGEVAARIDVTPNSVSFTITDTGIGVPSHAQPRLFSKFYRANNARQWRPEGAGLGLFMAKKIITAQGGAIIFRSAEGKGSTFGFNFPRRSVEARK